MGWVIENFTKRKLNPPFEGDGRGGLSKDGRTADGIKSVNSALRR